jgi:PhzF family phenazine biosynthesis protein
MATYMAGRFSPRAIVGMASPAGRAQGAQARCTTTELEKKTSLFDSRRTLLPLQRQAFWFLTMFSNLSLFWSSQLPETSARRKAVHMCRKKGQNMKIWTVDAFAKAPYTGNPAAVTIVPEFPEDAVCHNIAAEMNLSETVFVKPLTDGTFHIRWFTPLVEVELCGHGTLATAHVLFQEGLVPGDTVTFTSLSGLLHVTRESDALVLNFPLKKTGTELHVTAITEHLEMISESVVTAVNGNDNDIILELSSPEVLRTISLDPQAILKLKCRFLMLTAKGDGLYDFISRVFAPSLGIDEDPVTGSAHCKLAYYWQQKLNTDSFLAYQASARGGEIHITIQQDCVLLKGHAITVMEGNWLV